VPINIQEVYKNDIKTGRKKTKTKIKTKQNKKNLHTPKTKGNPSTP